MSVKRETLPKERKRIVKPGPKAAALAKAYGEQLSEIERKQEAVAWNLFKLRVQYEVDCYEAGVEPVKPPGAPEGRAEAAKKYRTAVKQAKFRYVSGQWARGKEVG